MSSPNFACNRCTDPRTQMVVQPTTAGTPYLARSFLVTSDPVIGRSSNYTRVSLVQVPPNTTNVPACGLDIAMLRLSAPIAGATLMEPRRDQRPIMGAMFTAVGYGATDGNGTGT